MHLCGETNCLKLEIDIGNTEGLCMMLSRQVSRFGKSMFVTEINESMIVAR